jgi:formylglycine-generating enzyme required for sulfatase activity
LLIAIAAAQQSKPTVPDKAVQETLAKELRDLFKAEYARRDPDSRKAFAKALLLEAEKIQNKPAQRFVMFSEARDIAAEVGDVETSFRAIDRILEEFDLRAADSSAGMKLDVLMKARKLAKGREETAAIAEAYLKVARDSLDAGNYDAALQAAKEAGRGTGAAGNTAVAKEAADLAKEAEALKKEFEGVVKAELTLSVTPDDPQANLDLGRFLCFVKGDWELGLKCLSKGSDAGLKAIAEKELAKPRDAEGQAALGDAWLELSKKESKPICKERYQGRARECYERALPGMEGFEKLRVQRQVASLGTATGPKTRPFLDLGGGVRMDLVHVKPGTFTMGGTEALTESWQKDERPPHQVTITKGYSLGKYEVTRGQFAAFVKATSYKTDAEKIGKAGGRPANGGWTEIAGLNWQNTNFTQADDHPAVCISWNDAKSFCDWAGKKSGRTVRLPTEAEWEYACRAGTKTRWSFGDSEGAMGEYGWYDKNSGMQTQPVGRKRPNAWGLYDMHGNVWEWCEDWWGPYSGDAKDPLGPASGSERVVRGGCWVYGAIPCRSAFRGDDVPSMRNSHVGFRVCLP